MLGVGLYWGAQGRYSVKRQHDHGSRPRAMMRLAACRAGENPSSQESESDQPYCNLELRGSARTGPRAGTWGVQR